ncbi:MAG: endonuclease/exonuclease/phosphatase family protein [Chitinophagales bacterium]
MNVCVLKIATWNLERLEKHKTNQIIEILNRLDADILVLTETSRTIYLENYNVIHTKELPNYFDGLQYKIDETRVSIFSKFEVLSQYPTYDDYTALCVELRTPMGDLLVYESIIGVFGNKQPKFDYDLYGQLGDFKQLFPNKLIYLAGDFNITFAGRAWPSN